MDAQLFRFASTGQSDKLARHLTEHTVKVRDKANSTLLHVASENGQCTHALPDVITLTRVTLSLFPFSRQYCCIFVAVEIVELLLRTPGMDGTIINAIDHNGDTAALIAARSGHDEVLVSLLEARASVAALGADGAAVIHLVVQRKLPCMAMLLRMHPAEANRRNQGHATPLHVAVSTDADTMPAELLLGTCGISIDAVDASGDTPLHVAVRTGNLEQAQLLLDRKANANIVNAAGDAPLHVV
jgi:ankyrin repeat protein